MRQGRVVPLGVRRVCPDLRHYANQGFQDQNSALTSPFFTLAVVLFRCTISTCSESGATFQQLA